MEDATYTMLARIALAVMLLSILVAAGMVAYFRHKAWRSFSDTLMAPYRPGGVFAPPIRRVFSDEYGPDPAGAGGIPPANAPVRPQDAQGGAFHPDPVAQDPQPAQRPPGVVFVPVWWSDGRSVWWRLQNAFAPAKAQIVYHNHAHLNPGFWRAVIYVRVRAIAQTHDGRVIMQSEGWMPAGVTPRMPIQLPKIPDEADQMTYHLSGAGLMPWTELSAANAGFEDMQTRMAERLAAQLDAQAPAPTPRKEKIPV